MRRREFIALLGGAGLRRGRWRGARSSQPYRSSDSSTLGRPNQPQMLWRAFVKACVKPAMSMART
jgi:hypothetical protein